MLAALVSSSRLEVDGISDSFEIFHADAKDETKIFLDKI